MVQMKAFVVLALLTFAVTCHAGGIQQHLLEQFKRDLPADVTDTDVEPVHNLWPFPSSYKTGDQTLSIPSSGSLRVRLIGQDMIPQIAETLQMYKSFVFPDEKEMNVSEEDIISLDITINDLTNLLCNSDTDESYALVVTSTGITLTSETYVGFLRGIETLSQLMEKSEDGTGVVVTHVPVEIQDSPRYAHRGLMVDTARHFIRKEQIMEIMDGLMYAKMNVFHWHISDTDSFPIYLESHPNLSEYGAFSKDQMYSLNDVKEIVAHAVKRGIRIIPELDSPSHVASWKDAPEFSSLVFCTNGEDGQMVGQIDPTQDVTYEYLGQMIKDIESMFPWEYVHLGSDEAVEQCWDSDSIKKFMKDHDIADWKGLFNYYITKAFALKSPSKTALFWSYTTNLFLKFPEDSTLQYWGSAKELKSVMKLYPKNSFILSPSDYFYLDCGYGGAEGGASWCAPYKTWKTIYSFEYDDWAENPEQVFGGEVCEWSEINDTTVVMNRVFPRAAALGEKVWSPKTFSYGNTLSVMRRLNAWIYRVIPRGLQTGPITSGYCEKNLDVCVEHASS